MIQSNTGNASIKKETPLVSERGNEIRFASGFHFRGGSEPEHEYLNRRINVYGGNVDLFRGARSSLFRLAHEFRGGRVYFKRRLRGMNGVHGSSNRDTRSYSREKATLNQCLCLCRFR